VPDSLLESEFFGHARGSFTGAYRDNPGLLRQAHGGTVFLDEVGEMSLRMQALLLRFLETGEIQTVGASAAHAPIDVRVITATNRNLLEASLAREFREDLYYRLNVFQIKIPPLRDRAADIPLLVDHYLQHFAEQHKQTRLVVSVAALERLVAYGWPGNIRELRNVVERLVLRVTARTIVDDFSIMVFHSLASFVAVNEDRQLSRRRSPPSSRPRPWKNRLWRRRTRSGWPGSSIACWCRRNRSGRPPTPCSWLATSRARTCGSSCEPASNLRRGAIACSSGCSTCRATTTNVF
jgi:transcriptional regulator with GAF, ATPase, and Fis domain